MLVILKIEGQAKTHTVSQSWIRSGQALTVGRSYGELVVAHDPDLARAHFEVSCDGRQAWLRDLSSPGGTFLNGQRVERAALRPGDKVRAGRTTFVIAITGQPASEEQSPRKIVETRAEPSPSQGPRRSPVRVVNETCFQHALLPGHVRWPENSVTIVVKGTFALTDGQRARLADKQ